MRNQLIKVAATVLVSVAVLHMSGCGHSPVRNPFASNEPKLGGLPAMEQSTSIAAVSWSSSPLAKQDRFSKLKPLISANTIYAADHSGKIVALDRASGKKLWSQNTKKKFVSGPTVMNNVLLLSTSDAFVVALDATTGHMIWDKKISSEALAPPVGSNNVVLVHSIDGSVSALDGLKGDKIWHVEQSTPSLTLHYSSSPVIIGNTALVGFSTGKLMAMNLQSGLIEWERVISLPRGRSELQRMVDISADPVVIGDVAYVITYQGKLAAVNVSSGNLDWEREISAYQNMAFDHQHLYVTDNDHSLWAIDRNTGATMWKQDALAERFITGPAMVDGMVVVGDRGGYVHFLEASKGQLISRMHMSGKFYQGPQGMGKDLLVSNHQGKIAAIHCSANGRV